jgi:hypothetical protein
MMMGRGGQQADSVSTAKWDAAKLTIVTKQEMAGRRSCAAARFSPTACC